MIGYQIVSYQFFLLLWGYKIIGYQKGVTKNPPNNWRYTKDISNALEKSKYLIQLYK